MNSPQKLNSVVAMADYRLGNSPIVDWAWLKGSLPGQSQPKPDLLHHYTNAAGAYGIIAFGKLWATHAHFLNDSNEGKEALAYLESAFAEFLDQFEKGSQARVIYDTWRSRAAPDRHDFYVTCFTECDDDLNQWRSYAGAAPFQLSVRTDGLGGLHRPPFLLRCVYTAAEKHQLTVDALKTFFDWQAMNGVNDILPINYFEGTIVAIAVLLSALFKHEKFSAEREWRLVESRYPNVPEPLCFRATHSSLVPYTQIEFEADKMVAAVGIGPSDRQAENEQSIAMLLRKHAINAQIWKSQIPFRSL